MPSSPVSVPLVVQHNALVNARFRMSGLEMRLFLALLSRIGKDDGELGIHLIPVRELCPDTASKALYAEVKAMREGLLARYVDVEELGPNNERVENPNMLGRPLMGMCDYLPREGMVRAAFNVHMKPYLLALTNGFFTKAHLGHLLKLKSPAAHRIYWLLREAAAMRRTRRTLGVDELRAMLGIENQYVGRFDHFRARVLDPAREELAQTDLAFTYTTTTKNRAAHEIVFSFAPVAVPASNEIAETATPLAVEQWSADSWQALLLASGVTPGSVETVQAGLDAGTYDEGYIRHVVALVGKDKAAGKIKSLAGAIYMGITKVYYLHEYRTATVPVPAKRRPALTAARKKLQGQLEDARGSLQFVRDEAPANIYPTPEARAAAVAEVMVQIAGFEAEITALGV